VDIRLMDDDPRPLDVLDIVVINLRGAKKTPAADGDRLDGVHQVTSLPTSLLSGQSTSDLAHCCESTESTSRGSTFRSHATCGLNVD